MLYRHTTADGATAVTTKTWGPFASGAIEVQSPREKFSLENVDTRSAGASPFTTVSLDIQQSGVSDGHTFLFTAADTNGTISKPFGAGALGAPTGTILSGSGVWGSTGQRGYRIAATNATGETIGSTEVIVNIGNLTDRAQITWIQTPGATGYKVFRTDTPGTYGGSTLRATLAGGGTITFIDDGSATAAGSPQADNTTGGSGPAYGTPPAVGAFTQADKLIASAPTGLRVGEQFFYWAMVKVPAQTSDVGNTRTLRLLPVEAV